MAKKPAESEKPPRVDPDAPEAPPIDPGDMTDDAPVEDLMPEALGLRSDTSLNLLLDACKRFNVDPRMDTRPRELDAWRFYPGSRKDGRLDAVSLVTAGGLKLTMFSDGSLDADTEERLRALFRAFRTNPVTKQIESTPLPEDQGLPEAAVIGAITATSHRHAGGYLRRARDTA
jgi:hypothetical protein